jgi:ribonuclease Z
MNLKNLNRLLVSFLSLLAIFGTALANPPEVQEASSVEDIQTALSGGVPGERWKEGLLFEGIKPSP